MIDDIKHFMIDDLLHGEWYERLAAVIMWLTCFTLLLYIIVKLDSGFTEYEKQQVRVSVKHFKPSHTVYNTSVVGSTTVLTADTVPDTFKVEVTYGVKHVICPISAIDYSKTSSGDTLSAVIGDGWLTSTTYCKYAYITDGNQ